jgi:four helix bundle protein
MPSRETRSRELKDRTKQFAIRVIRLVSSLPKSMTADVIGKQLFRSATSVGANYRSACRAKSPADFVAKMAIVEEEADECGYWMEIIVETKLMKPELVADLLREANEIVAIVVASIRTTKGSR